LFLNLQSNVLLLYINLLYKITMRRKGKQYHFVVSEYYYIVNL
jgi:hypothetical protein